MFRVFLREGLLTGLWLLVATLAAFAALDSVRAQDWFELARHASAFRLTPDEATARSIPLAWNPSVDDARARTLSDLDALLLPATRAAAAARLGRRGAAAVPTIMSRLPSLPPEARFESLRVLGPIASTLTGGERAPTPERVGDDRAVTAWWDRFYAARLLDFRVGYAERQVARLALHDSPNAAERVARLGTYALPALVLELDTAPHRDGRRRVTNALSSATGVAQVIPTQPATSDAEIIAGWKAFWFARHLEYETLSTWRRSLGHVVETRYGQWFTRALAGVWGRSRVTGRPVRDELQMRLPMSTLTSGLGGLLAVASIVAFGGGEAMRRRALRVKLLDLAGALIPGIVAFVFAWSLVLRLSAPRGQAGALAIESLDGISSLKAIAATASCAALASLWLRRAAYQAVLDAVRIEAEEWAAESLAPTGLQVLRHGARIGAASLLAPMGLAAPGVLLASLIVELVFGLRGMGSLTLRALAELDGPWLMAAVTTLVPLLLGRRWALALLAWLLGVREPHQRAKASAKSADALTTPEG